ncbi:MAG: glycosyltransferase family 2 protein [Candidatus Doudnabacteria bacterium]|nr:glycosyltransferase family 2 protein [Candidatus Doudnabacteria bacterium]
MKLIVQVPCYNEEETLPLVINSIPKKIEGVDVIETLIIDDGSKDRTIEVAKELGVDHVVAHKQNKGLAISFADGIHACLTLGADVIVNTDGDNQYPQKDIGKLIKPILDGSHDIVIGDRQVHKIMHFSGVKKFLQKLGSTVVKMASGVNVEDAPSGFRAYSKDAAMQINIVTDFSYVIETIVQAGKKRIPVTNVLIDTNPKTRESRLFNSILQHVRKHTIAIFRSYAMHEPFKIFFIAGMVIFIIGVIPYARMGYLMVSREELIGGHLQSLILGAVFIILGFMVVFMGVMADLLAINRKLIEDNLRRLKELVYRGPTKKYE